MTQKPGERPIASVVQTLRSQRVLLILDNCEHVIEAATAMAEALLRAGPAISVLATSREPLRASGEHVYRVPPLAVPAEDNHDIEDRAHAPFFLRRDASPLTAPRAKVVVARTAGSGSLHDK